VIGLEAFETALIRGGWHLKTVTARSVDGFTVDRNSCFSAGFECEALFSGKMFLFLNQPAAQIIDGVAIAGYEKRQLRVLRVKLYDKFCG
jgi:hypothetical protein